MNSGEEKRLEALYALNLLDSPSESEFDELIQLVSSICECPVALLSLVDEKRQWFKSKTGTDLSEIPRESSFCDHTLQQNSIFVVEDASLDPRFYNNTYVTGEPNLRFYAGIPIREPTTHLAVGSLCVIDVKARKLSEIQRQAIATIRGQIEQLLRLRSQNLKLRTNEQKLNRIADRQESILETAQLGSWDWWVGTDKLDYDARWFQLLGIKKEEAETDLQIWESRLHPEDKDKVLSDLKEHYEGRTPSYENVHRLRHSSGDWIWVLDRGQVTEWDTEGKAVRMTGTVLDISVSKKEEFLTDQVQSMAKIGGWQYDVRSRLLKWSKEVFNIYSLPHTSTTNLIRFEYFAEQDIPRIKRYLAGCHRGHAFCDSFMFEDASGTQKVVEVSGRPERDAQGQVSRLIGTIQDVTERVTIERHAENSRIQATHAAKLASLGEMAAGLAHEINNPLAIILGTVGLLPKVRQDEQGFQAKLNTLEKAVGRISRIVGGLKRFSRTDEAPTFAMSSALDIINEALLITEMKSKKLEVPVTVTIQSEPMIFCDPIEIEQVLINLIGNGIDAVSHLKDKWVKVELLEKDFKPIIRVIDSGPGISQDLEQKIFNPFFTSKPIGQGTGLGLPICKGILDRHKAKVFINRSDYTTTCFEIQFSPVEQNQKVA